MERSIKSKQRSGLCYIKLLWKLLCTDCGTKSNRPSKKKFQNTHETAKKDDLGNWNNIFN